MKSLKHTIDRTTRHNARTAHINISYANNDFLTYSTKLVSAKEMLGILKTIQKCIQNDYSVSKWHLLPLPPDIS